MANRRQFIQSGITLSAASTVGALPKAALAKTAGDKLRLDGFVYDSRFAEAQAMADQVGRQGVRLWAVSENLIDLWNDHLDVAWKKTPKPVGGMTTRGDLFFLETIANDRGMRVVYRGEHAAPAKGQMAHILTGPQSLFDQAALTSEPDLWAPLLGKAIAGAAGPGAPAATLTLTTSAPLHDERDEPLFSWVLAPRSRPMTA